MPTEIITTAVTAFVREDRPKENFGNEPFLAMSNAPSGIARAFIFFPLTSVPPGAVVLSATLRVTARNEWLGAPSLSVRRVDEKSWQRRGINWSNRPNSHAGSEVTIATGGAEVDEQFEIDLTSMVAAAVAGVAYFGFRLSVTGTSDRRLHSSRSEEIALRPTLEIEWVEDPLSPTDLSPSGGRAFSGARPILSWLFRAARGIDSQAQAKVQVGTDAEDPTSEWISDWVVTTEQQMQVGVDLPEDTTLFWRVQVRDGTGRESPWSEVAEMIRYPKGTLAITAPPASPANIVEETAPPIVHDFSGVQTAVQHELAELRAGNWVQIHTEPRRASTDDTWTPPIGLFRFTSRDYRITVRVWDDIPREDIPGDPSYVQAQRTFTFARSDEVSPVDTLTAVAHEHDPSVRLRWTDAGAPDFYGVRIDGELMIERLIPAEVEVAPGEYCLDYWAARPLDEHEVEIERIADVAGTIKHSEDNPTASFTTRPFGVWIIDEENPDERVVLVGPDDQSFAVSESATQHTPKGRRDTPIVYDRLGGYSATLAGALLPYDGVSARTYRQRLERMKGQRRIVRVVLDDFNFPAEIGEFGFNVVSLGEEYQATVPVFQRGEFTFEA